MKTPTLLLILMLLAVSGCVTISQPAKRSNSTDAFEAISAVCDSHKENINLIINPYRLRCRLFETETTNGVIRLVSIDAELTPGATTYIRHHFHEPPVVTDTTTYKGLLQSLPQEEVITLASLFDEMSRELRERNFTIAEGSKFSPRVWLERPGLESQQIGAR